MAPSKESHALAELFKQCSAAFPTNGDPFLTRAIYDQVQTMSSECEEVSYEDSTAGPRPGIWIHPESVKDYHVILYIHGGAFAFGSPNSHRKLAAHLAKASQCHCFVIDYRLVPENPYPAGLDDCIAAYQWLLGHEYEPNHVVIAGDSCGGGLAASVALAAFQRGLPRPGAVVSLSPWYDLTNSSESYTTNAQTDFITAKAGADSNADRYLARSETSKTDPLVSPFFADLTGLPPIFISCAGDDVLRDEGVAFAEKARKAGVEVEVEVVEGVQHVFQFMAGRAPEADESIGRIGEWVRKTIGS